MKPASLLTHCFSIAEVLLVTVLAVQSILSVSSLISTFIEDLVSAAVWSRNLTCEIKSALTMGLPVFPELYCVVIGKQQISCRSVGGLLAIALYLILAYFVAILSDFRLAGRYILSQNCANRNPSCIPSSMRKLA